MEIKEITAKDEWEEFLTECNEKTFLQSWNWGEFQIKNGNKIWRLGVFEKENLIGVCLVIKFSAKRGTFLFIPHGPVLMAGLSGTDKKEILELILLHLTDVAKEEKASFIRVSPILNRTEENNNIFIDLGFREAPMHSSAYEATWKLDIAPAGEDLLHNMRKTTRYLIRKLAENPDVLIEKSNNPESVVIYQKLNKEVSKRQKFIGFSGGFIKN